MELESFDTLRGWFLPEAGSIWTEGEVLRKLGKLALVPAQQALVDNGLREDQWHLPKDQASQPLNEMIKRLRRSMSAQRQSSVLLLTILDQVQRQTFNVKEVLRGAHPGAVKAPGFRDSFGVLDQPIKEMLGDVNPQHSGLLFPGSEPAKPDLSGLLDNIPEEVRQRINITV